MLTNVQAFGAMEGAYSYPVIGAVQDFLDSSLTAIIGGGLPSVAPDPADFGARTWLRLYESNPGFNSFEIRAHNPQIAQIAEISEPSSIALFGAGLTRPGAMAWLRRRTTQAIQLAQ